MTTTINSKDQVTHSRRVLTNKGDVFPPFNVEDSAAPHGKDEEWKFAPLRKLRGLRDGTAADPVATSVSVETTGQDGVVVDVVKHDDERLDRAGTPTDRMAAQMYSNLDDTHIVTFAKSSVSKESVVIGIDDPDRDNVSYGHIVIDVQFHAEAVCVINYCGSGTFVGNIEFATGNGAKLSVVTMVNWSEDAVHGFAHHTRVGRDATLYHAVATFGGKVVRVVPRVAFTAPGGDADLLGMYFTDASQYFENRMLVNHAMSSCRSNVIYKGALQSKPDVAHREARTAWVRDVLIRTEATGTSAYEPNRSLLLTEGARANAVPNLEVETGRIAGAWHAATVGRLGEGQLFYLLSRDIPELAVRRLVVRDFFSEVINLMPVESAREKLEELIDEESNTADL